MKQNHVSFYGLFFLGFILKFFHVHYNAVLMLIGIGGILILSIISLFSKENRRTGFLHFGMLAWIVLLFISIKFLPFENMALIIAFSISVILIITLLKGKQFKNLLLLSVCISVAMTFYLMRTDYRYFLLDIKWNYEIDSDFITLDKYSWFLYINEEFEKALQVSNQSLEIVKQTNQSDIIKKIEEHNKLIQLRDWKTYH